MPSLVVRLDGLDFAAIDDTLGRVRTGIEAAAHLSVSGLDPMALLGELGTVVRAVQISTRPGPRRLARARQLHLAVDRAGAG
jgi:hypothetical protein